MLTHVIVDDRGDCKAIPDNRMVDWVVLERDILTFDL